MAVSIRLLAILLAVTGAASAGLAQSGSAPAPTQATAAAPSDDPFVWLEEPQSERALAWVRKENERTLATLQADPRYKSFYDRALEVLQARDRIPPVQIRPDGLYNFWQDETHVKGIVRRTTMASYRTDNPQWETVLDIDALAAAEKISWVYQGMNCLPPAERRCLVFLSDGGRDANVVREFDLVTKSFVEGGFNLPNGKQNVDWVDQDTILVGREWGEGTMTTSGYPFIIKSLKRGQALADAKEMFRGKASDTGTFPAALRDSAGNLHGLMAIRYISTFEQETSLLRDSGPVTLNLPRKSNIGGLVDGRLLVSLDEPWEAAPGLKFPANSVISWDLAEWKRDPNRARPSLVWAAGPRQALGGFAATRNRLLLTILDNVRGRAFALDYDKGAWRTTPIALPANATIGLGTASSENDQAIFSSTDYLTPATYYLYDGASGSLERIKTSPTRFDSSGSTVEQYEAVSRDGTKIPYFLIRPKTMRSDGSTPTLLYGYGGFQSSEVPYYSGTLGRLWLEQGNAYVVANLRGGGEFGPEWHQSAQGAHKQRTWDDYIAVAEDLIRRKVTSPRRLGVVGGSQGGLLVGTAITQRPELFNAAIIQVPLFDMLRYHLIGAGSSWIGEYGDPTNAEQRAWLEAYSPYQKLVAGKTYPAPFINTSTADDRVQPGHGRKAAARLASLGQPYLYYENMEGGHAAAANHPETARRLALEYVYASRRLVD